MKNFISKYFFKLLNKMKRNRNGRKGISYSGRAKQYNKDIIECP